MDETSRQTYLDELCPQLQPIADRVMSCAYACETLDFFRYRRLAWLEATDVAHYLQSSADQVARALEQLSNLGILQRRDVLGTGYYGLSQDPAILNRLDQFWAWRDDWCERWERVRSDLKLDRIIPSVRPV